MYHPTYFTNDPKDNSTKKLYTVEITKAMEKVLRNLLLHTKAI
jgi:hypothetical protein